MFHEYGALSQARFARAGAPLSINLSLPQDTHRNILIKATLDTGAPVRFYRQMDGYHTSFREGQLPLSWKDADIVPVPQKRTIQDVNKHLRLIALTPILFKIAEDYVVHDFVMPAVLKKIDGFQ